MLGLVCTAGGFLAGGLAVVRLGARHHEGTVLPLGLLVVSVVAGVWEFATSGLEMSMVFLWLGVSFLLLVRVADRRRRALPAAFVAGLGPLIRPELLLGAAVLTAALVVLVALAHLALDERAGRRGAAVAAAAAALPAWSRWRGWPTSRCWSRRRRWPRRPARRGGPRVPPTSGISWRPYTLWLPFVLAVPAGRRPGATWWRAGDRTGVLAARTPLVVGLGPSSSTWCEVGGDYMHARLLLPAFFAFCLPVSVGVRTLRGALVVPAAGIAVWSLVVPRAGCGSCRRRSRG